MKHRFPWIPILLCAVAAWGLLFWLAPEGGQMLAPPPWQRSWGPDPEEITLADVILGMVVLAAGAVLLAMILHGTRGRKTDG